MCDDGTFRVEFRSTILGPAGFWSDTRPLGRLLHYCTRCSTMARLKLEQCSRTALIYDDESETERLTRASRK